MSRNDFIRWANEIGQLRKESLHADLGETIFREDEHSTGGVFFNFKSRYSSYDLETPSFRFSQRKKGSDFSGHNSSEIIFPGYVKHGTWRQVMWTSDWAMTAEDSRNVEREDMMSVAFSSDSFHQGKASFSREHTYRDETWSWGKLEGL